MNNSNSPPAKASERVSGHITDFSELPEFTRVLSHGEKPALDLFKAKQSAMVAVEVAGSAFLIIALENERGGTAWFHLMEQGKRIGLRYAGHYSCTQEVLDTFLRENVYEKDAVEANKRREEERSIQTRLESDSPSIAWLRKTVASCLEMGATDIHFEIRNDYALLRVRIDGIVRKVESYPARIVNAALSAGYTVMAEESSRSEVAFNSQAAQSAMIPIATNEQKVLLRYQSHPAVGGYDAIMRILKIGQANAQRLPELETLGYTPWQMERIREASASSWGGIFIAGITGSGKTTTLSSLLNSMAKTGNRKIISIEDPVEYQIPGVSHLSVRRQMNDLSKNPFEPAMMAFLRMDPDVGMFGEIRDRISAQMAQSAIQTGHKLLTTVHATSALGIVPRLASQQIGLLREDICTPEFLSLLMYQTLVPRNCPHCMVPAERVMDAMALKSYEKHFGLDTSKMRCASDTSCEHCRVKGISHASGSHIGVKGVKVCAEVIPPSLELMRLLRDKEDIAARMHWLDRRTSRFDEEDMVGKEAWGHALFEVSRGVIDPYHFELSFGPPALLVQSRGMESKA